ncbi:nuclear transport factor 2 family protein [Novosphingobium sp.]|uniref:nuclear transport factor 2 family protein n=1 Tax=Novosphingobium sp. TaxID=1874826 RepID=UPI00333F8E3F
MRAPPMAVLPMLRRWRTLFTPVLTLGVMLASGSPALAHRTAAEVANQKVVIDFYAALNAADAAGTMPQRIQTIAETYLDPDYVQHSDMFAGLPGPGSARDKLIRLFQSRPAMPAMAAPTTVAVMAQDDRVMLLTSRAMPDPATGGLKPAYIFNMFRVKNGRLVEHWDIMPMPPGGGGPGMMPGGPGAPPPAAP